MPNYPHGFIILHHLQLYTAKQTTVFLDSDSLLASLIINTIGSGLAIALVGTITLVLFVTTVGASFQYLPA